LRAFPLLFLLITINNTVAVEHLFPIEHHGGADEEARDEEHGDVHLQHCHVSRSSCSEQPIPSGPGQMLFADSLLPAVNAMHFPMEERVGALLAATDLDPPTPPPQN